MHLALAAVPELPAAEIRQLRKARRVALERRLEELKRMVRAAPCPEIATRLAALTKAELVWMKSLKGGNK